MSAAGKGAGRQAIDAALLSRWPDQPEPLFFRTRTPFAAGGPDPLDAVAVLRVAEPEPHWFYLSYGLSDLDETAAGSHPARVDEQGRRLSGWGMEFTLRVADPAALDPGATPPAWPPALLQQLARHVHASGEPLGPGTMIVAGHRLVSGTPTELSSLLIIADDSMGVLDTPAGRVQFCQVLALTADEAATAGRVQPARFATLLAVLQPLGIIRLDRASVLSDPRVAQMLGDQPTGPEPQKS